MPKTVTLEALNAQLKAGKMGVRIEQRGERLSLCATLPPRVPGGAPVRRIALNCYANEYGLKQAHQLALRLASELASDSFEWAGWVDPLSERGGETCGEWVEQYRQHLISTKMSKLSEEQRSLRWRRRWYNVALKWLPAGSPLSEWAILQAAQHYPEDSRARQVCCQVLQGFARFAGVDVDLTPYKGGYKSSGVRRDLPTDEQIERAIDGIRNPQWKRVAALMATYGLRDHECWHHSLVWVEDAQLGRVLECRVGESTKTGGRAVLPLHPAWVERWGLHQIDAALPQITAVLNEKYGEKCARQFKRYSLPFTPYDLRHCFGVRASVVYRLPVAVSAAMMGHSPAVHLAVYNRHLTDLQKREAYRVAVG